MQTSSGGRTFDPRRFWDRHRNGRSNVFTAPDGRFRIVAANDTDALCFLKLDAYVAANAFVNGEFDVHGDLIEAVRYFSNQPHSGIRNLIYSMLTRLEHLRMYSLLGTKDESIKNLQYHYDRSNDFYSLFLDSRMVYSAGCFDFPDEPLDRAQERKLDMICRDLVLSPNESFLDIGCGWGALILHAAERFGAQAYGCTIAAQQLEYVEGKIVARRLRGRVSVSLRDYREAVGSYDKIASVGMFEHVGKARLAGYFRKIRELLKPGGLFLNRGVVRTQSTADGADTLFLQHAVFPGGELVHLDDVLREGERAGLEPVGMRDLRIHYGLTCKAWVKNLEDNKERCQALVGDRTYRTWLLYLAASSVNFEEGRTSAAQMLFSKPRG